MSDLGAASIGFVFGLAIVGAVLLRNEEEVRKTWRRRFGGGEPKAGPTGRWPLVFSGLVAIAYIAIAVVDRGAFRIILAAAWLLLFSISLLQYRRSRRSA